MKLWKQAVVGGIIVFVSVMQSVALLAGSLVENAGFSEWSDGKPVAWKLVNNKQKVSEANADGLNGADKALCIEVTTEIPKKFGEIRQQKTINVPANTDYCFSGWLKSSRDRACFFMVKLYKDGKEVKRLRIGTSGKEWMEAKKTFNTGDADSMLILCRYQQSAAYIGTKCYWGKLSLGAAS